MMDMYHMTMIRCESKIPSSEFQSKRMISKLIELNLDTTLVIRQKNIFWPYFVLRALWEIFSSYYYYFALCDTHTLACHALLYMGPLPSVRQSEIGSYLLLFKDRCFTAGLHVDWLVTGSLMHTVNHIYVLTSLHMLAMC